MLQIMAALSGCKKTAKHVNLLNTGEREDVYTEVAIAMNKLLPAESLVNRGDTKKPVMTHNYNKSIQDTFDEDQKAAFYTVLADSFEGAEAVKDIINDFWDPEALEHVWTLPDGHIARVKVTEMINTRIEVDELDHTTFTYRFEINQANTTSTSLVPNIIHSIDAYVAREMIRRAYMYGFELAHIHDAFCAHPNNMQKVRELYVEILAEIADNPILENILSEISGKTVSLTKTSTMLGTDIRQSEYALS
jgi:DNA-directed RNA polymerase